MQIWKVIKHKPSKPSENRAGFELTELRDLHTHTLQDSYLSWILIG